MTEFLLLSIVCGIQLLYLLVFARTAFVSVPSSTPQLLPGVSLIVCAWNELQNLRELIPLLEKQEYETFEIIIVNDKSTDGSSTFLQEALQHYSRLKVIPILETPLGVSSKKFALTQGIDAAQYEVILLTDADCRPHSSRWIQRMVAQLSPTKDIVLGVSPYFRKDSSVNAFIQFETFYTALQYISFALVGNPYMGVGRNLLYRKSLFLHQNGLQEFMHILGGDDDLFINKVANATNTAVCLHPQSLMYSVPKVTWAEWWHQKRRHVSVGSYYRKKDQFLLGLLAASHVTSWLFLWGILWYSVTTNPYEWMGWSIGIFLVRFFMTWIIWYKASRKLAHPIPGYQFPIFDLTLTLYLLSMAVVSAFPSKKMSWR
ncbi:glycosyltransferase [Siphonobacter sp. SORGH_AS_0500]|uniref:glycosyltransferase n=1 Tax=Siphonobacter sp. SORGH_AS_0500 TaxID=1864824 RepID=UPI00285F7B23|nr:glycosyltransferase [Siphonobacter sp. SORGH_AS_0500]MDR6193359.1 glycosyltransferase involved in cell wall biosynthesis [Siphonobacter sp. SORGH_AS_0500]